MAAGFRQDFFLGGSLRNLDDLNAQLRHWLDAVANPRVHATTQRVVNEAFAEEKSAPKALPLAPYRTILKLERRVSHEGMVSIGGNLYSVPDTTRRRVLDVHVFADEIRVFEAGALIASHAIMGEIPRAIDAAPSYGKWPRVFTARRNFAFRLSIAFVTGIEDRWYPSVQLESWWFQRMVRPSTGRTKCGKADLIR